MPFDGTNLDETTQVLIRAKEVLLRDGWCINVLADSAGRHCINGAIFSAASKEGIIWPRAISAMERLARHIPDDYPKMNPAGYDWGRQGASVARTASYNNAQISVEPILELLDKAIASG